MPSLEPDVKKAAKDLQLMVRAEAAVARIQTVVISGQITSVYTSPGECACTTCGKILPYKASKALGFEGMDGGHFLAKCQYSRAYLDERNVHPQCVHCNQYRSGAGEDYELWMRHTYGQDVVDELRLQKNTDNHRWDDAVLIQLREEFRARTRRAEEFLMYGDEPEMGKAKKGELIEYQPRQLTLDFDYDEYGIGEEAAEQLNDLSAKVEDLRERDATDRIELYFELASQFTEAKKHFRRQKSDVAWSGYCKVKLGASRSKVDEMILTYKSLGKLEPLDLAGIPVSALPLICREGTSKATRNRILKLAKDNYLTKPEVQQLLGDVSDQTETKAVEADPVTEDEIKERFMKKLNPVIKKFRTEAPAVLRAIADELIAEAERIAAEQAA